MKKVGRFRKDMKKYNIKDIENGYMKLFLLILALLPFEALPIAFHCTYFFVLYVDHHQICSEIVEGEVLLMLHEDGEVEGPW